MVWLEVFAGEWKWHGKISAQNINLEIILSRLRNEWLVEQKVCFAGGRDLRAASLLSFTQFDPIQRHACKTSPILWANFCSIFITYFSPIWPHLRARLACSFSFIWRNFFDATHILAVPGRLRWIIFNFLLTFFRLKKYSSDFLWSYSHSPFSFTIRCMFFLLEIQWSKLWPISFSRFYSERLQKKGKRRPDKCVLQSRTLNLILHLMTHLLAQWTEHTGIKHCRIKSASFQEMVICW